MGSGPLAGVRIVELAGIGPAPFAAMVLGDLGADVVVVDRPGPAPWPPLRRSRRSIVVDLKRAEGADVVLRLAQRADALIEGLRPGVVERLGVGPDACLARNPRLVYGRMTGWGQDGPWTTRAGHDLNYIAVTGLLHAMGSAGQAPPVPLNLIGDFGGGGMLLALGVVAALLERDRSGQGQVVDAAMVDGAALLTTMVRDLRVDGSWSDRREDNFLDGAAPFYGTYACADGRYLAVGALEPQFYALLLDGLGLELDDWPQHDRARWPQQRAAFTDVFATRSRDEWLEAFDPDACVTPVLDWAEAPGHPQLAARQTFTSVDGLAVPAPAPRFSRTPAAARPAPSAGADSDAILADAGFSPDEIAGLRTLGVLG